MTMRAKAILVTLEDDRRADDLEATLTAIRQLRGVLDVSLVPASIDDYVQRTRIKSELFRALYEVLNREPRVDA